MPRFRPAPEPYQPVGVVAKLHFSNLNDLATVITLENDFRSVWHGEPLRGILHRGGRFAIVGVGLICLTPRATAESGIGIHCKTAEDTSRLSAASSPARLVGYCQGL